MEVLNTERKGISWRDKTLASISSPPHLLLLALPLLLVILVMFLSTDRYNTQMQRTMISLRLLVFLLPVLLILIAHLMFGNRWWWFASPIRVPAAYQSVHQEGSSPWVVLLVVLLLLLMVYYKYF